MKIKYLLSISTLIATAFQVLPMSNIINVDASYSDKEIAADSTRFTSLRDALLKAEEWQRTYEYTDSSPLTINIAPSVYWIDDPDDPAIRNPKNGSKTPFGMELTLSHIRLIGLSKKPENVVIACNRGQTQGANGNFTMFHITGEDIQVENLTLGNYCNVDLIYPLNPALNRKRRENAIVQAQLAIVEGDRVVARNCRFISRLNLCPFSGARRALFEDCYFESTDDALCGTGVYHRCRFTFFSGKPFYSTSQEGAKFLDCDIHALTAGKQYLVKVGSPVAMIDCRWTSDDPNLYIGWTQDPTGDLRSYQYNVTLNGAPIIIDSERPQYTVDITGTPLLEAYKCGETYNIFNLVRGNDGWNPTGQDTTSLPLLPTMLSLDQRKAGIETRKDTVTLQPNIQGVKWHIDDADKEYVAISTLSNGNCEVTGLNESEDIRTVNVKATTASGLETACVITVRPPTLQAPEFTKAPEIICTGDTLQLDYQLNLGNRPDHSLITWYRATRANGSDAVPVAVSRLNNPEKKYALSAADNGYYILAEISPRHNRSLTGETLKTITDSPINVNSKLKILTTDFVNFPTSPQKEIRHGFWTVDAFKPADTAEFEWEADAENGWYYGEGMDGAAGLTGLIQSSKGARLLYQPLKGSYGDMSLSMDVDPCKTAGQGFGSATGQYMDIYIKFDPTTLTGYALRIIRTPKTDKAVCFMLMQYENGIATPITESVTATCYRRGCKINLNVDGNQLTASVTNTGYNDDVNLTAEITPNEYGGVGVQHTGSTGASSTLLRRLTVDWK